MGPIEIGKAIDTYEIAIKRRFKNNMAKYRKKSSFISKNPEKRIFNLTNKNF